MATENQHKPNDFTPVVGAMNLAEYVMHITENPKKFRDYSLTSKENGDGTITQILIFRADSLTNMVRNMANQIYLLTYAANRIRVDRQPWRKDERLEKQAEASRLCEDLLAEIQLCRKHYHLSSRQVQNWGEMVVKLKKAIDGWHEKDKDRYKNI